MLFVVNLFSQQQEKGELWIKVNNIDHATGMIWVGVYNSTESFMIQSKAVKVHGVHATNTGSMMIYLQDLPFDTYAFALFHDIDNDGRLNQNFIGIPTEPYAFSSKVSSRWRKPYFKEMKFPFTKDRQTLSVNLTYW